MRTNVAETSIDCWYGTVLNHMAKSQADRTISVMRQGNDYTLSELVTLTGIDKSSMSRVINGLRAANRVEKAPRRKCSISNVAVIPSKLVSH